MLRLSLLRRGHHTLPHGAQLGAVPCLAIRASDLPGYR